jgi:hypothetical protein
MAILLIIAGLILIGIIALIVKARGGNKSSAPVGRDRFKHAGPGEAKPKEPRATGLD